MDQLPILVVHGGLIWKVALAAFVVGMPLFLWRRTIRRARCHARRARARLGPEVDSIERFVADQPIAIVGRLAAHEALPDSNVAAVSQRQYGAELSASQGTGLAIEVEGTTVPIEGAVTVVAGSHHRWHLSLHARSQYQTHEMRRGDKVLARGRLRASADVNEGSDYRTSKTSWTLMANGAHVELATLETVRSAAAPPGWQVYRAVFGALIFVLVFGLGGKWAQSSDHYSLAAATPFHRDWALRRLSEPATPMTKAKLERQLAVLALRDDCGAKVEALFEARRYTRAIEASRACAKPHRQETAAVAAAWLVDYELSSDLYAGAGTIGRDAAMVHILAGRWDRAETTFTRWAAHLRIEDEDKEVEGTLRESVAGLRCLAQGAAVRAGRPQALEQLRALAKHGGEVCTLTVAELLPRAERRQYLADHPGPEYGDQVRRQLEERYVDGWPAIIVPRFSAGNSFATFDVPTLPMTERILHADVDDGSVSSPAISLRAAQAAGAALDNERALRLAYAHVDASEAAVRARAYGILAAIRYRQRDLAAAHDVASETGYSGALTRALIAMHRDGDTSLFREETTTYRDWGASFDDAVTGDTGRLERHLQDEFTDGSRFSHALALFGQLLPSEHHERYAEMLAHRGDSAYKTGVGFMFLRDSTDELAASNLDAPELAALYRERLARRYQVLRNPTHGAFLALIPL